MSQVCSKTLRPRAKRVTRKAASRASSVFPAAMPKDVAAVPCVVKLAMNAPIKIAGQKREPSVRKAAMAMPVGGHTGAALGWGEAKAELRRDNVGGAKGNARQKALEDAGFCHDVHHGLAILREAEPWIDAPRIPGFWCSPLPCNVWVPQSSIRPSPDWSEGQAQPGYAPPLLLYKC